MKLGGQSMTFMVDTRAEHSVIITSVIPLTGQRATIIRATGDRTAHSFCKSHSCQKATPSDSGISILTGVSHSPTGQRLTDKAWHADYLCPQEACEPHPVEPISSDDGYDCALGRRSVPLFFRERTDKSNQPAKSILCCPGRKGAPRFGHKPHTLNGGHEAKGHCCQIEAISSTTGGMPGNLRPHPMPA